MHGKGNPQLVFISSQSHLQQYQAFYLSYHSRQLLRAVWEAAGSSCLDLGCLHNFCLARLHSVVLFCECRGEKKLLNAMNCQKDAGVKYRVMDINKPNKTKDRVANSQEKIFILVRHCKILGKSTANITFVEIMHNLSEGALWDVYTLSL